MMDLSSRSLHLFGILLITVLAASCAQPVTGGGTLPTAPSLPSVGPSGLGPGASYNAEGTWRFVSTDVHGNVDETFDVYVTQDGDGNLSFPGDEGFTITLKRLGTGVIITYRLSFVSNEGGDCDALVQGTARLDTRTNTMTLNAVVRELGCSHGHFVGVLTATKLS